MKKTLVYLAVPYTHKQKKVMKERFRVVTLASAILVKKYAQPNFSPITQSHLQAKAGNIPGNWDFWKFVDTLFVKRLDELWVLMIPGWLESTGVQAEIKIAKKAGIPIKYLMFEETTEEITFYKEIDLEI